MALGRAAGVKVILDGSPREELSRHADILRADAREAGCGQARRSLTYATVTSKPLRLAARLAVTAAALTSEHAGGLPQLRVDRPASGQLN